MEFIVPRPCDHVDLASGAAAGLSAIKASKDLEFGNSINAWVVQQAEITAAVHVVGTIDGPVVLGEPVPIDGKINFVRSAAGGFHADKDVVRYSGGDARRQRDQLFIVALAE